MTLWRHLFHHALGEKPARQKLAISSTVSKMHCEHFMGIRCSMLELSKPVFCWECPSHRRKFWPVSEAFPANRDGEILWIYWFPVWINCCLKCDRKICLPRIVFARCLGRMVALSTRTVFHTWVLMNDMLKRLYIWNNRRDMSYDFNKYGCRARTKYLNVVTLEALFGIW